MVERDNSGLLGNNNKWEKANDPNKRGSCMVGGVEYWISGWDKENQYGPFTSLSFTRKDAAFGGAPKPQRSEPTGRPAPRPDYEQDDIPFN